MCKLFLLTLVGIFYQQKTATISPDGKFKLTIEMKEESDLQTRYITKLTDNDSKQTIEIANCVRRDLSVPNFYWSNDSRYLIFEQCSDSFKESRIKILNLTTKKIDFELMGLIGNRDKNQQQFDAIYGILFYFDTSITDNHKIPRLYVFDLKTKKKKLIQEFEVSMNMEFPVIQRVEGRRQIKVRYHNDDPGQIFTRQIDY